MPVASEPGSPPNRIMPWPRWLMRVLIALLFVTLVVVPVVIQFTQSITKFWTGHRHYDTEYKAALIGQQTKTPERCKAILRSRDLWSRTGEELWSHRRACDGMTEAMKKMEEDKEIRTNYNTDLYTPNTSISIRSSGSRNTIRNKPLTTTSSATTQRSFTTTTVSPGPRSTSPSSKGLLRELVEENLGSEFAESSEDSDQSPTWLGAQFKKRLNLTQVMKSMGLGTDNSGRGGKTSPIKSPAPKKPPETGGSLPLRDTYFESARRFTKSIFIWPFGPFVNLIGQPSYKLGIVAADYTANLYNRVSVWWVELTDFGHVHLRQHVILTCSEKVYGSHWEQCQTAIDELGHAVGIIPNEQNVRHHCFARSGRKSFEEISFTNTWCTDAVYELLQELHGTPLATNMNRAISRFLENFWILWAWFPAVLAASITTAEPAVVYLSKHIEGFSWTSALLFFNWITVRDATLETGQKAILVLISFLTRISVLFREFDRLESIVGSILTILGLIIVLRYATFIKWLRTFKSPVPLPLVQRADDNAIPNRDGQNSAFPAQDKQDSPIQDSVKSIVWLSLTIELLISVWDTASAYLSNIFSPISRWLGLVGNYVYYIFFVILTAIGHLLVLVRNQLFPILANKIFLSLLGIGTVGSALHQFLQTGVLEPIFEGLEFAASSIYLLPGVVVWAILATFLLNVYVFFVDNLSAGQRFASIVASFLFLLYDIGLAYILGNSITLWLLGVGAPMISILILTLCSWTSRGTALRRALHQQTQDGRALRYTRYWVRTNTNNIFEYILWMIFMTWWSIVESAPAKATTVLFWIQTKHAGFCRWLTAKFYSVLASGRVAKSATISWIQTHLVLTTVFDFFWYNWLLVLAIWFARCSSQVNSFLGNVLQGSALEGPIFDIKRLGLFIVGLLSVVLIVYCSFSWPHHESFGTSLMILGLDMMQQRSLSNIIINSATFITYCLPAHIIINLMLVFLKTLVGGVSDSLGQNPMSFWPIGILYFATTLQISPWRFLAYFLIWRYVKWARENRGVERQYAAWQAPTSILLYAFISNYLANDINQLSVSHLQWLHQITAKSEYLGGLAKLFSFALLALFYQVILWGWSRFLVYIGLDQFPLWTNTAYTDTRPIIIRAAITQEWRFFKNAILRSWQKLPTPANLVYSAVTWVREYFHNLRRSFLQAMYGRPHFQSGGASLSYLISRLIRWFRLLVSVYIFDWPFATLFWILSIAAFVVLKRARGTSDVSGGSAAWLFWLYEILMWLLLMHFTLLACCFDRLEDILTGSVDAIKKFVWTAFYLWPVLISKLPLQLWNVIFMTAANGTVPDLGSKPVNPARGFYIDHWIIFGIIFILTCLLALCCWYLPSPSTPSTSLSHPNRDQNKAPWQLGQDHEQTAKEPIIFFPRSLDGLPDGYQPPYDVVRVERLVRAVFALDPSTELDAKGQSDLEAARRLSGHWLSRAIADVVGVLLRVDYPHLIHHPHYREFNKALTVMANEQTLPADFVYAQEMLRSLGTSAAVLPEPEVEQPFQDFLTIPPWFSNVEREMLIAAIYHAALLRQYPTPQREARATITAFQEGRKNDAFRHWNLLEGSLDKSYYPYGGQAKKPIPNHVRDWNLVLYHRAAEIMETSGPLTETTVLFARRALSRFYFDEPLLGRLALQEAIRLLKDHPTGQSFPLNWPEQNLEEKNTSEEEPIVNERLPKGELAGQEEPSPDGQLEFDTTEPDGLSDEDLLTFRKAVALLTTARVTPPGERSYAVALESIVNFFKQGELVLARARFNRLSDRLPPADLVQEAVEDVQRLQSDSKEEIQHLSDERPATPPLGHDNNASRAENRVSGVLQDYNIGVITRDVTMLFQKQPALNLDTLIQVELRESILSNEVTFNGNIRHIVDKLAPDFKFLEGYADYDLFVKALRVAASPQTSPEDFAIAHQALRFLNSDNLQEAEQILAQTDNTSLAQPTEEAGIRKLQVPESIVKPTGQSRTLVPVLESSVEPSQPAKPENPKPVIQSAKNNGTGDPGAATAPVVHFTEETEKIQPVMETPNISKRQLSENPDIKSVDTTQGTVEDEPQSPFDPRTPEGLSPEEHTVFQRATHIIFEVDQKKLKDKARGDANQVIRYLRHKKTKAAIDLMRRLESALPDLKLEIETPISQQPNHPAEPDQAIIDTMELESPELVSLDTEDTGNLNPDEEALAEQEKYQPVDFTDLPDGLSENMTKKLRKADGYASRSMIPGDSDAVSAEIRNQARKVVELIRNGTQKRKEIREVNEAVDKLNDLLTTVGLTAMTDSIPRLEDWGAASLDRSQERTSP